MTNPRKIYNSINESLKMVYENTDNFRFVTTHAPSEEDTRNAIITILNYFGGPDGLTYDSLEFKYNNDTMFELTITKI